MFNSLVCKRIKFRLLQLISNEKKHHFQAPLNVGSFKKQEKNIGTAIVQQGCGDVIQLQIKVAGDGKTIERAVFKTFGCSSSIACASYVTQLIKGLTIDSAYTISATQISEDMELPRIKYQCSSMIQRALKDAIKNFKTSQQQNFK